MIENADDETVPSAGRRDIRVPVSGEPLVGSDDRPELPGEVETREDWLKTGLFSLGDAVIVTNSLGKVTLLNPSAEALTGWLDRDARNLPIQDIFKIYDEATGEPVVQPVLKVLENGEIHYLGVRTVLVSRDGSERSIDDSASPMLDKQGAMDGVILIFRDVSERRRYEIALEYHRLQGEGILATVRDSLLVLDQDLVVKSANSSFYKQFGAEPQETLGWPLHELGGGAWYDELLRDRLGRVFSDGSPFDDYKLELNLGGSKAMSLLLNARLLRQEAEGPPNILLAIEDLTVLPGTIRALAAAEIRIRRLFDDAEHGILILRADTGAILEANPHFLKMMGYTNEHLIGKTLREIGILGDVEASQDAFRGLQEKGYVRYDDLPMERSDGSLIDVEVVSVVYRIGESLVIQCNIRDISQRKRAEAELKQAKEQAEEASRQKDRFLATLSHELRTPLTPVLATLAYVERLPNVPPDLREDLALIRRNVELEARLIDDLLDVTRIAQGKLGLAREVVNCHASLRSALDICQGEFEEKGMEITLGLKARIQDIWADPVRIQQVFWNLIKNAVKFTPTGGRISVRTWNGESGRLTIEFADTGMGLEEKELARIFEPFEQVDRSQGKSGDGLGLGLSIAKTLVELHGGGLTATSAGADQGSIFRVELETVSSSEKARLPGGSTGSGQGLKVLFVEDNQDTRNAVAILLSSVGCKVRSAGNVKEALATLNDERFDLLISDIGLPDGSGLEIMRHGLVNFGLKGIALSGYGSPSDVQESLAAGFSHHLTKPASLDLLVDLITRIL